MDDARKGDAALSASKNDEAIEHFTKALSVNATAVKYYIGRSTAYQRTKKYNESLADAEIAVVLAQKRGVRELIKDAQFRRALALFHLGRYADAEFVLGAVKELDPEDKMLPIWNMKIAAKFEGIAEDDEQRKATVKKVPDFEFPSAPVTTMPAKSADSVIEKSVKAPKAVVPTPANKIKYDWYQTHDTVTINIMAKGVPKDLASVDMGKDAVSISFPISGSSSDYSYSADPLYASIDPAQSKYRVTPNKVEVTLRKASPGVKWHNIEGDREVQAAPTGDENTNISSFPILTGKTSNQNTPPAYPTSSKSGSKNWDKITKEDLDDKDEIEGDDSSHFFKKLYGDATPEQQRAMMKSYSESGGTVLSTDWSDVGSKTMVPQPPEGMEAKRY
ncbi:SGS-domain-containing protein [Clathrospora elynae]|uniref:SGS-domain-containing protein n=1 Tax=Clathrospora elynae TaxID=706981 RepID=A0A6A5SN45_9PLEO|nr:SGS-domain-containing protein [Clathrospora elynae]